jgi:hypothetical protein
MVRVYADLYWRRDRPSTDSRRWHDKNKLTEGGPEAPVTRQPIYHKGCGETFRKRAFGTLKVQQGQLTVKVVHLL